MEITGRTQVYAVLGHPIAHTLSPAMHNASFRALGLEAVYVAFDVKPARLPYVLPALHDLGVRGVNLTVPLKEAAWASLAEQDVSAQRLGAVNTVEFLPDGRRRGHNTDGYGFLRAVEEAFGRGVEGRRVFVLGAGGAGRAVAITCAVEGAARVDLTDQMAARADRVAAEIRTLAPSVEVSAVAVGENAWRSAARDADLVVQATPVGMRPEDPPLLPAEAFREGQDALDLVYMYPETAFMRNARAGGARAANGLGMLLHQGARAFTIWTGLQADLTAMRQALEQAVYGARSP